MLERRAGGQYALSAFFEHLNDIDVYIEDTAEGYQKIFATLLSRAMSSHISINRVFPLGSRTSVVAAALHDLDNPQERKAVYIVDGDLYLLCGEYEELPRNVVRLDRYCIENFLIDAEAMMKILNAECHKSELTDLQNRFDYSGWIERSLVVLKPLFVAFAAAHGLQSGIKCVSYGSKSICADGDAEICANKSNEIRVSIFDRLIESFGQDAVNRIISHIESNVDDSVCFISKYVSAKDFLLPLLFTRMRSVAPTKASNLSIKMRLAMECNVESLSGVVSKVSEVLRRPEILPRMQ